MAKLRTDFHFALVAKSRSTGFNAVHGAAYRAGERLEDANGNVYDYTRRQLAREVASTFIVTPGASDWPQRAGREALWQAAEAAENRKNSVPAYELELSVPHEMPRELQLEMLHEFAAEFSKANNVAIDVALHVPHEPDQAPKEAGAGAKKPRDEVDSRNHHAHLLIGSRVLTETGFGEKLRWLADNRDIGAAKILHWRARWADIENKYLAKAGIATRVSPLSYKELGIDVEPTQHEGRRARYGEKRGLRSDVVAKNKAKKTPDRKAKIEAVEIPDDYATPRAELLRQRDEIDAELRRLEDAEERELIAAKRRKQAALPAPKPAPRPQMPAIAPADDEVQQEWLERRVQNRLPRYPNAAEPDVRALARYWRDNRLPNGAWEYINKAGRVVDAGDRITADHGNGVEIDAMIRLAKAKAWSVIQFTGPDDFKSRAMAAALRAGLEVTTTGHDAEILARARVEVAPKPADPLAKMRAALERAAPSPAETPPAAPADAAPPTKPPRLPGRR